MLYTPYIPDLTQSEIHAVMTGGFSTVAGKKVEFLVSTYSLPRTGTV